MEVELELHKVIKAGQREEFRFKRSLKGKKIEKRRRQIHAKMSKKFGGGGDSFSPDKHNRRVKHLFRLYNKMVFAGEIQKEIKRQKKTLKLQWTSGRDDSKVGGWCKTTKDGFVLSFPMALYESLSFTEGGVSSGGLIAHDKLGALQLTMEHELIHLIIQLTGNRKKGESHGELFRYLVYYYFRQTECKHHLGLGDPSEWGKMSDFAVGDWVQVRPYNNLSAVDGRITEILRKYFLMSRLSDGSIMKVSPKLLKKIPSPATNLLQPPVPQKTLEDFVVGDYVRTKRQGKIAPFCAIIRAKMIKFILIQKRGSKEQFKIRPTLLEKISEAEYGDSVQDVPLMRKNFTTGDYVKFTHQSIVLYGQVDKKMPKNIQVSFQRDGQKRQLRGDSSLFTLITKSEFLDNQ